MSDHELKRWKRPRYYIGKSWPDWYVGLGRHRESDTLDQSNFEVFFREVQAASDKLSINEPDIGWDGGSEEIDSVHVVREGHSLVGWVEWVAIHKDDKGALAKAQSLFDRLNRYPVLDEDHWGNLEDEEINQYWQGCSIRERVDICRDAGVSIFAARHKYIVEDAYYWLRDTWR